MSYKLTFDPSALESLKSLDKTPRERIFSKIKDLRDHPEHFGKPLSGIDLWVLRIGDYRVLFDLYQTEEEIHVVKIGHRRDIYGDL